MSDPITPSWITPTPLFQPKEILPEAPASITPSWISNPSEAGRLWYQQQYDDLMSLDSSQEMEAKRLTAIYLAKALQVPARSAYLNFDNYAQDYFKSKDLPLSYLQAAQNQWRRSWTDIETSKLGLMMDPDNEEKWSKYDELMAGRPREDNVQRNLLGQAGLSAIQFIPSMVDTGVARALFGAGGALVGAGIGSTMGPGGTAAGAKVGWNIGGKIGGTIENINLEANSIFLQVMNTIDPTTGKPVYKNPDLRKKFAQVARSIAIPFGALAGALEELSFEKVTGGGTFLKPLIENSGLSVIKNWVEKGKLQNYFTTLIAKYGTNIATETLQEMSQTLVEQLGTDMAIEAGNAAAGTSIPTATLKDYVTQLTETAKSTAMGMSLIGLGGSIRETREAMGEKTAQKNEARRAELLNTANQALKEAQGVRAAGQAVEQAAAPQVPQTVRLIPEAAQGQSVAVPAGEAGGEAAAVQAPVVAPRGASTLRIEDPQTSTLYGTITVDTGTASVGIQKLTTVAGFESQAKAAVVAVMAQNPGKAIVWDPQDTIGKRVRDQLLAENPRRQGPQQDLVELQAVDKEQKKNLETAPDPVTRATIEADLKRVKAEIRRTQKKLDSIGLQWYDESTQPVQAGTTFGELEDSERRSAEPWRETRAEFVERFAEAETPVTVAESQVPQFAERAPQNAELRRRIGEAFPGWNPVEADHAAILADLAAEAKGMTTQEWMDEYLAPGVFADSKESAAALNQGKKAAVEFLEDGRALIHLSQTSDFSSWVHELSHVFRRQLSAADMATAAAWAGATETAWSEAAEEKFAKGFEDYLREGLAPTPELRGIYERFADWMRRIYRSIRSIVSPEIRGVYDRILTRQGQAAAAGAPGPKLLNQPGNMETRRQQVGAAFQKLEVAPPLKIASRETAAVIRQRLRELPPTTKSWVNSESGALMTIPNKGLKEAISRSADPRKAILIERIGDLFETAVQLTVEPHDQGKKKSTNIRAWHHYAARVNVNGQDCLVRITAKEVKESGQILLHFYDLNVSDWENRKDLQPRRVSLPKQGVQVSGPSVDSKIQQLLAGVNTQGFSPKFNRWFRASKVVDSEGRPLVVYHGTDKEFDTFLVSRDLGFHFGTEAQAKTKGSKVIAAWLSIQNPLRLSEDITQRGDKVPLSRAAEILTMEAGLDAQTVDRLQVLAAQHQRVLESAESQEQIDQATSNFWTTAKEALEEIGYDGVVYPNQVEGEGESWIAFDSIQVKGTSNNGEFSLKDRRFLFQSAEPTESAAFKAWFGDSKITDGAGAPQVVYHGTDKKFEAFDKSKSNYGGAFYFTSDAEYARSAGVSREAPLAVYLSIKNPYRGDSSFLTAERVAKLQAQGYDGIIGTVSGVKGTDGKTVTEYVAFEPNQAKSVENQGTWSPTDSRLLYQPDPGEEAGRTHEETTREAVEAGEAVGDDVLADYADRDWAKAEIERRARYAADAATFATAEEFGEYAEAMADPGEPVHDSGYWSMIWEQAREAETTDRKTANERFLASMDREGLSRILQEAAQKGQIDNLTGIVKTGAMSVKNGGILSEKHYAKIMDQVRDDPAAYRAIFAGITGDEDAIRQLEAERREKETAEEKLRAENRQLRRENQKKENMARTAARDIRRERSYSADLEKLIQKEAASHEEKLAALKLSAREKLKTQKTTATEAGRAKIKAIREKNRASRANETQDRKSRTDINRKVRDLKRIQSELKYMHPDARKPIEDLLKSITLKGLTSKRRLALTELRQRLQADPDTEMSEHDMEVLAILDKTSVRDMSIEDFNSLYNAIKHFAWRNRQIQSTRRGEQELHKEQARVSPRILVGTVEKRFSQNRRDE